MESNIMFGIIGGITSGIIDSGGIVGGIVGGALTGVIIRRIEAREAQEAWVAENEQLKQSALQGDVDAQYQLGNRYREKFNYSFVYASNYIAVSPIEEAIKWFKMAADSGHEEAVKSLSDTVIEKKVREVQEAKEKIEREEREKREKRARENAAKEAAEKNEMKRQAKQHYISSKGKKCLICEHWGGNSRCYGLDGFEQARSNTGRCYCDGTPHYYNNDYLSANDSCGYWKLHPGLQ
jgi:TPR repeat protein